MFLLHEYYINVSIKGDMNINAQLICHSGAPLSKNTFCILSNFLYYTSQPSI